MNEHPDVRPPWSKPDGGYADLENGLRREETWNHGLADLGDELADSLSEAELRSIVFLKGVWEDECEQFSYSPRAAARTAAYEYVIAACALRWPQSPRDRKLAAERVNAVIL